MEIRVDIGDKNNGKCGWNTFTITGAESGRVPFQMYFIRRNDTAQTVTGKTETGNVGIAYGQTLDEKQKALSEKLKEKDKMT